jgi:hypothetical protein
MIGSFGLWSSSKGMKVVSNLVGVNKEIAKATIVSDGFIVGTETPFNTGDSAELNNHNKVRSQVPVAGTLFTYELPIDIVYTNFSFVPFSVFGFSPFGVFGFSPFSFNVFNDPGFQG